MSLTLFLDYQIKYRQLQKTTTKIKYFQNFHFKASFNFSFVRHIEHMPGTRSNYDHWVPIRNLLIPYLLISLLFPCLSLLSWVCGLGVKSNLENSITLDGMMCLVQPRSSTNTTVYCLKPICPFNLPPILFWNNPLFKINVGGKIIASYIPFVFSWHFTKSEKHVEVQLIQAKLTNHKLKIESM